jgi:hypothetical protein
MVACAAGSIFADAMRPGAFHSRIEGLASASANGASSGAHHQLAAFPLFIEAGLVVNSHTSHFLVRVNISMTRCATRTGENPSIC